MGINAFPSEKFKEIMIDDAGWGLNFQCTESFELFENCFVYASFILF
jgi:hypothetical protein